MEEMISGSEFAPVEDVVKVEVPIPSTSQEDGDPIGGGEGNIGFDDLLNQPVLPATTGDENGVTSTGGGTGEDDEEEENDDGEVYEVESILQERTRRGVKEYFVRWKGYGPEYDTWEPEDNLNCDEIIEEFERSRKEKQRKSVQGGNKRKAPEPKPKPPPAKKAKPEPAPKQQKRRGRPPGSGTKAQQKRKDSSSDSDDEPATVIRCKTRFKKFAIEHAIKTEDDREPSDDKSDDPLKKYFFKYDIPSDQFLVGDTKVDINEETKHFGCSVCKKQGPVWGKKPEDAVPSDARRLAESIKNHIIGQHLGGFLCAICDKNQLYFHSKTLRSYQYHMTEVHRRRLNMEQYDKDNLEMDEEDEQEGLGGGGGVVEKGNEISGESLMENGS